MPSFEYEALDKNGKTKKGKLEGNDIEAIKTILKAQGLIALNVTEQNMLNKDIEIQIGKAVSARELSIFCRQLNGVLNAGVTITTALELMFTQTENKHLKKAIHEVQIAVEKGDSLASAMAQQPKIFPEILVNMVGAGEASGSLDVALERMTEHFEKSDKLHSTVMQAMLYPVIVIVVAIAVIAVMLIKVVPTFAEMFDEMDAELPGITLAVMGASNFLVKFWPLILGLFVIIGVVLKMYGNTSNGKLKFGYLALHMPLIGKLVRKSACATFTRTLSTLLAAGITTIDAVEITSKVIGNQVFKQILLNVKDEVERGVALSEPLEASGEFPPMVYHMVGIGEETGSMETMLDKVADYYEAEVEIATETITTIMEPVIIVVLAVIVGTICIAVLQPMLTLYSTISESS